MYLYKAFVLGFLVYISYLVINEIVVQTQLAALTSAFLDFQYKTDIYEALILLSPFVTGYTLI